MSLYMANKLIGLFNILWGAYMLSNIPSAEPDSISWYIAIGTVQVSVGIVLMITGAIRED